MTNLELVSASPTAPLRRALLKVVEAADARTDARLPPERALTAMLGIKRGVLRGLLAELEAEGRIWRHVGRGTFAGARPARADQDLKLVCEHTSPTELLEARLVVEPQLAAFAAARGSEAEIAELRLMARKCASAPDYPIYEKWDESLHGAIAKASRNRTLYALFNGLNAVRREVVWHRIRQRQERLERRQQRLFSGQHDAIVRAIAARDPEAARQAMRQHLESFDRLYLSIEWT